MFILLVLAACSGNLVNRVKGAGFSTARNIHKQQSEVKKLSLETNGIKTSNDKSKN